MSVALAAALAVVLVAAAALGLAARRRGRALVQESERVEQANARLAETGAHLEQADQLKRAAEVRATAADKRSRTAERKAADAERRAGEAEQRVGEAIRRAEEAERAGAGAASGAALWGLERLRTEREWLDVMGPGASPPVPWDGSVGALVAAELSVIREVIGTPSQLNLEPAEPLPPARAIATARFSVEMLRTLARSGEEMEVVVGPAEVTVVQPVSPGEEPPDLTDLAAVAQLAGFELTFGRSSDRSQARLGFP
jgi:hypothetical protein